VIKILSETRFERIGGTATGGGTFWGLGRLLTKAKGFDEVRFVATVLKVKLLSKK
jgi:pantothenate kinase